MIKNITSILKLIVSFWKPDFRKSTGWLFITSGLVLLAPNFIQELILNFLQLHQLVGQGNYHEKNTLGILLIAVGILYHLLLVASKRKNERLETFIALTLVALIPVMIYLSL